MHPPPPQMHLLPSPWQVHSYNRKCNNEKQNRLKKKKKLPWGNWKCTCKVDELRVELESAYSKIIFLELEIFEEANAKMDRISNENLYIYIYI